MNFSRKKITIFSLLFLSLIFFVISIFYNRDYLFSIANCSSFSFQVKQFLSIITLYICGFLFLKIIQSSLPSIWVYLLAFPCGAAIWSFACEAFLLCDFTLRPWRVVVLIVLFLATLLVIRLFLLKQPLKHSSTGIAIPVCLVLSISLLVSSGIFFIVVNYDSYFYFSDYGKAIAKLMCYKDIVSSDSYVLTNIGQFLPLISTYATYWGIDTIFPYHLFMLLNLLITFSYSIYETAITHFSKRKTILITIAFCIMLISCSPFFLFSNWVLSNSWIMFYLFPLFLLWYKTNEHHYDALMIICLFSLAITMLRKDGLIIVSFLLLAYSLYLGKKKALSFTERAPINHRLALVFLPCAIYDILYIYILKNELYATVHTAASNSFITAKNQFLITLCSIVVVLYLLFVFYPLERLFKNKLPIIISLGIFLAFSGIMLINYPNSLEYIDAWCRNFAGIGFGYSIFLLLFLFGLSLILSKEYDYALFVIIGYILLVFIIYESKGNTETNIDNSGLRAFVQIIPVLFFTCCHKIVYWSGDLNNKN